MENQNMENNQGNQGQQQGANGNQQQNNQGQSNQSQQSEKLFTQDDVNRIVQDRLARYKGNGNNNGSSDGLTERERNLNKRELTLEARERLADAGLPKDLLDAVNCNSKDEMEKSIKALTAFFGIRKSQQTYRVSTGTQTRGNDNGRSDEANIRKAMGLKGR